MGKHLIVVFTEPVEGREDDYNAFYNKTHLPEVVASEGVVSGQRFVLAHPGSNAGPPHPYLTIYEIEGDLDAARVALAQGHAERTPLPGSFDVGSNDWWFTAISEQIVHSGTD